MAWFSWVVVEERGFAVVLVAATAFAAVLIAIVKSDVVKTLLTGLIKKALSVG